MSSTPQGGFARCRRPPRLAVYPTLYEGLSIRACIYTGAAHLLKSRIRLQLAKEFLAVTTAMRLSVGSVGLQPMSPIAAAPSRGRGRAGRDFCGLEAGAGDFEKAQTDREAFSSCIVPDLAACPAGTYVGFYAGLSGMPAVPTPGEGADRRRLDTSEAAGRARDAVVTARGTITAAPFFETFFVIAARRSLTASRTKWANAPG